MLDPVSSARAHRAGWLLAAAAVVCVLAVGNLPLIVGHATPKFDAADLFEPMFAMVGDATRSGHLLRWDPWSGAGTPDWAQPEFGTTSPVLILFSVLPGNPLHAYIAYWLSVWCFGGLGMLLLAEHFGCPPAGAAIVACGFATSGFFTGHAEHMTSLYSVSYLPWILWRFDSGLKRRDWRRGIQAGALYGLSALGGYPAFTILTPGFLALWAMARILSVDSAQRRAAAQAALASCAALLVVGFMILAPPYLGLLTATRGYTDYIGPRPRDAATGSNLLPAGALSTLASPALAELNRPPHPLWPETDISMTSVYMGSAMLLLALVALRGKSWRWYIAAMGAFLLCCALGSQTPLRGWLYDLIPPTRYFRNPSLFRAYVIVLMGVLAAMGARDLAQSSAALRVRLVRALWHASAILAAIALGIFEIVTKIAGKPLEDPHGAMAHLCAAWLGIAALSFLLKSGRIPVARFLQLAAVLACLDGLGSLYLSRHIVWDDDSASLRSVNAAHQSNWSLSGLDRSLVAPEWIGQPITNRSLLVKQPVFDDYTSRQGFRNRFQKEILSDAALNRMAVGSARVCFSSSALWSTLDQDSFRLFQASVQQQGPGLVLHSPAAMLAFGSGKFPDKISHSRLSGSGAVPCFPAPITDLIYQPELLAFRFEAPAAGYLLVTDRWADGWAATVNGQSRPVLGADFICRAVAVDLGSNSVRFAYHPRGFWVALLLSWGTLILVGGSLLYKRLRNKPQVSR